MICNADRLFAFDQNYEPIIYDRFVISSIEIAMFYYFRCFVISFCFAEAHKYGSVNICFMRKQREKNYEKN